MLPPNDFDLPKILYVADVPVEASHSGSSLVYRLFEGYPPELLQIIESELFVSQPGRRLPGVTYGTLATGQRRWLNSRLHGLYAAWLSWTAPARGRYARALPSGFQPDAIVTVAHGFGWLSAASLAQMLRLPLHLIVHDDWPRVANLPAPLNRWLDRKFGETYRQAASRLCVSPFMVEEYQRRYKVTGSVMYPSRSSACPMIEALAPRLQNEQLEFVVGYGGNNSREVVGLLKDLAVGLAGTNARIAIFGPFEEQQKNELRNASRNVAFHGLVPFREMIDGLREKADLLFMPTPFQEAIRENMIAGFPSKLADYTAIGLPILIYGPPDCSAVRWSREHPGVSEVVDSRNPNVMTSVLSHLRSNLSLRQKLAGRALQVGTKCFGHQSIQELFFQALVRSHPNMARV